MKKRIRFTQSVMPYSSGECATKDERLADEYVRRGLATYDPSEEEKKELQKQTSAPADTQAAPTRTRGYVTKDGNGDEEKSKK